MTISLSCSSCGRDYNLRDEAAGKQFRCKDCNAMLTVPEAGADDYGAGDDDYGADSWSNPAGSYGSLPPRASSAQPPAPKTPKKKSPARSSGSSINGEAVANILKILVAVVVAVGVGFGAMQMAKGGSYSWREFSPPGQPFSVQLPGDPKPGTQSAGGMFMMTTQQVEFRRPERFFGCMYATFPIPAGADFDVQAGLEGAKQGMLTGTPGSRIISSRTLNVTDPGGNQHPVMEVVATIPARGQTLRAYYRFSFVGSTIVVIMTGALDGDADDYEADFRKCLDSFKITRTVTPVGANNGSMNSTFGQDAGQPFENPGYLPPGNSFDSGSSNQSNPAADMARQMQEENRARMEKMQADQKARMEQFQKEHEERMKNLRNRTGNPTPGFPNFPSTP